MEIPPELQQQASDPTIAAVIAGERALFDSDMRLLDSKKAQLQTRNEQYREQIEGLKSQREAAEEALRLAKRDLVKVQDLFDRGLAPQDRAQRPRDADRAEQGRKRPPASGHCRDQRAASAKAR